MHRVKRRRKWFWSRWPIHQTRSRKQRGLFIIDPDGLIRFQMTTDGDVGRNAEEVLRVLQALQSGGQCAANWKPNKK
jgi:alkyl hydroperoxide reductase subunit AhpC